MEAATLGQMKTAAFVLLWLAGSAAAIGVAWTGIAVVDGEVLDPPSVLASTNPASTARAADAMTGRWA